MIEITTIKRIYFIGIGGIGMSAIARYFNSLGKQVSGYDKTPTKLTDALQNEGVGVTFNDDESSIDKAADAVVYTPAIPANHWGLNWYKANNYPLLKRSDILQIITRDSFSICIAGTHGKTSITTLVAHILTHSGYGCNAFLGGISVNYDTNFWSSNNNVCVIEADEYDRSFLKLSPNIAVITSTDADHLDIYGTHEAVEDAFVEFAQRIDASGLLIRKHGIKKLDSALLKRQLTYALYDTHPAAPVDAHDATDTPDLYASNIENQLGGYRFDVMLHQQKQCSIELPIGGLHNVENTLAAYGVSKALGLSNEKIIAAVAAYRGVKRRFEYIIKHIPQASTEKTLVFIDDYAHHPTELTALLRSVQQMFPGLECTILFQPHLYTRTRDFAEAFANALCIADHVLLLPIYPARELPIEDISSNTIAKFIPAKKVELIDAATVQERIRILAPQLFVTAGAGNIDTLIPDIANTLKTLQQ